MSDVPAGPRVRIRLVWCGPVRAVSGGTSFVVEYEGDDGSGCALLSSEEMEELRILEAYARDWPVPVPLGSAREAP